MFTKLHSIYGRMLGISSTRGIIQAVTSTGGANSTAFDMAAQMWGPALFQTVSTASDVISNVGVTIVSTDSVSGSSMAVAAPVQGVYKEIAFQTSATATVLHTTATTIKFNSTLAEAAAGGSTTLTIAGGALGTGGTLVLRGLSSTVWQIVSATVTVSS